MRKDKYGIKLLSKNEREKLEEKVRKAIKNYNLNDYALYFLRELHRKGEFPEIIDYNYIRSKLKKINLEKFLIENLEKYTEENKLAINYLFQNTYSAYRLYLKIQKSIRNNSKTIDFLTYVLPSTIYTLMKSNEKLESFKKNLNEIKEINPEIFNYAKNIGEFIIKSSGFESIDEYDLLFVQYNLILPYLFLAKNKEKKFDVFEN